jgi:hypothetical protein
MIYQFFALQIALSRIFRPAFLRVTQAFFGLDSSEFITIKKQPCFIDLRSIGVPEISVLCFVGIDLSGTVPNIE